MRWYVDRHLQPVVGFGKDLAAVQRVKFQDLGGRTLPANRAEDAQLLVRMNRLANDSDIEVGALQNRLQFGVRQRGGDYVPGFFQNETPGCDQDVIDTGA